MRTNTLFPSCKGFTRDTDDCSRRSRSLQGKPEMSLLGSACCISRRQSGRGKTLTTWYRTATVSPQALGIAALARTRLHNAGHDVVGVVRTRPIPWRPWVWPSTPPRPTYVLIEADTVGSPVVEAAAPNCGKDWRRKGENNKKGGGNLHRGLL